MRNAGRKGRKLGAYNRKQLALSRTIQRPVGFICGTRPEKDIQKNAIRVLSRAGKGTITIEAQDAHLLKIMVGVADGQNPEHISLYGMKNGNTERLMKRIASQVCESCEGNGWWLADMGEGADFCGDCKGTGTKTRKK